MSWVLILNSGYIQKPPAVIGGYPTREEAERAGDLATAFKNESPFEREPFYLSYSVIPGAACSEPIGATFSYVERNDDFTGLERKTKRWP